MDLIKKTLMILPLVCFLFLLGRNIWIINDSVEEIGIQISCSVKTSQSGKVLARNIPVVQRKNGKKVYGSIGEPKVFDYCKGSIGKKVKVLVEKGGSEDARIYTFWQFWFLPMLFAFFSLIWIIGIKNKMTKD